jgi:hypothetical protein
MQYRVRVIFNGLSTFCRLLTNIQLISGREIHFMFHVKSLGSGCRKQGPLIRKNQQKGEKVDSSFHLNSLLIQSHHSNLQSTQEAYDPVKYKRSPLLYPFVLLSSGGKKRKEKASERYLLASKPSLREKTPRRRNT